MPNVLQQRNVNAGTATTTAITTATTSSSSTTTTTTTTTIPPRSSSASVPSSRRNNSSSSIVGIVGVDNVTTTLASATPTNSNHYRRGAPISAPLTVSPPLSLPLSATSPSSSSSFTRLLALSTDCNNNSNNNDVSNDGSEHNLLFSIDGQDNNNNKINKRIVRTKKSNKKKKSHQYQYSFINNNYHNNNSNYYYYYFQYFFERIIATFHRIFQSASEALGIQPSNTINTINNNNNNNNNNIKMSLHNPHNSTTNPIPSPPSSLLSTLLSTITTQYQKVTHGFTTLQSSPSELYKAYLLKFLDSYAYFSFSLIFTLFLSQEFQMTDVQAGTIYGAWGALITIFGLFTGTLIDNLGVAKSLRIGFTLSFFTRMTLFLCTSKYVLLFCTLVALPLGNCLGIPVLTVGIRRYTNEVNRGFAFGLFYVVMNVGALVAGPLVDVLTIYYNGGGNSTVDGGNYGDGDGDDVSGYGGANDGEGEYMDGNNANDDYSSSEWVMTTNRAIILSGVVANFFAVFVAFSVREIKVDASNVKKSTPIRRNNITNNTINTINNKPSLIPTEEPMEDLPSSDGGGGGGGGSSSPKVSHFQPIKGSSWQILSETVRTPNFRRFLLVCLLTLNVRMVFRHLDGTLPKYMIREFGPDTPKGLVYSINPALIIILVPIITAATSTVPPLVMIHRGTYVSALSVFFLALSTSLPACVLFVITLSIGEALWSPRLYDFTMSVAQEGREGTYMALSSAPLFLAKLPVGFLSGLLLQRYCPETLEEGEVRHSKTMWWIIGLSTITSPIMITTFWGYISGGERARSDSIIGGAEGGGMDGLAMRIKDGERGVQDDDDIYGYRDQRDLFQNDDDVEDGVESPYQHRPLTTNISLPRVRGSDRGGTMT